MMIGDKFGGSPTCAEAPALFLDRGGNVAHGDGGDAAASRRRLSRRGPARH
jgi:hypothetical protein